MSEDNLNSLIYSKNVIELITVANEFCGFLERADKMDTDTFLGSLQKILPLLYLKASLLPKLDIEPEDELEKFVTEIDYNLIQQKVANHTGAGDDYQEVFVQGMQFSETALTSSIAENVADIYQYMKDLVMSFRTVDEEVIEQAVWECQTEFAQSWGQKLVNCLRAVHNLVYSEDSATDNISSRAKANDMDDDPQNWLFYKGGKGNV